MQDEGVERYGGTKDVADSHKFDEKNLEAYAAAHVEGFEGPMEVRQFKGGQSNPTYQLVTPKVEGSSPFFLVKLKFNK